MKLKTEMMQIKIRKWREENEKMWNEKIESNVKSEMKADENNEESSERKWRENRK
jgi:hypothetical protein